MLLRHAAGRAAASGRAFFDTFIPQGSAGDAFARRLGATYGLAGQRRALDLAAIPPGRTGQVRETAAKAAAGYRLVSWTGRTPDEYLTGVAAMFTAMNDAPSRPGNEPDIWDEQRVRDRSDANPETAMTQPRAGLSPGSLVVEAEAAQLLGIALPVLGDLDVQVQVDAGAE